jgi:hypothetical protein
VPNEHKPPFGPSARDRVLGYLRSNARPDSTVRINEHSIAAELFIPRRHVDQVIARLLSDKLLTQLTNGRYRVS